jgi:hypothetical protein
MLHEMYQTIQTFVGVMVSYKAWQLATLIEVMMELKTKRGLVVVVVNMNVQCENSSVDGPSRNFEADKVDYVVM